MDDDDLLTTLTKVDPLLQFWTKRTGECLIDLKFITVPLNPNHLQQLHNYGILRLIHDKMIGFPEATSEAKDGTCQLHGSTKKAAQKRMACLKRILKKEQREESTAEDNTNNTTTKVAASNASTTHPPTTTSLPPIDATEQQARLDFTNLMGLTEEDSTSTTSEIPSTILPQQLSYAGSHPSQTAHYQTLPPHLIPTHILQAFHNLRLYQHQVQAITSIMKEQSTAVCTGTGSGKSLCFLLPTLTAAKQGHTSLLLFPTKALAQDQLVKLQNLKLETNAAILDGDTPHSHRKLVAESAQIILTNPDTIHHNLTLYDWTKVKYVVIDEGHLYQGVFGAHVALILRRLMRKIRRVPIFIVTSATLYEPAMHLRKLCGVEFGSIVTQDTSPKAQQHFWVWNPPLLNVDGSPQPYVSIQHAEKRAKKAKVERNIDERVRRRHAADETAYLLAKVVSRGNRCIVFCKTRNLVEWVFDKCLQILKRNKLGHLIDRVESYRGGYSREERRSIEKKLFEGQLLGVVGTNALELGVDVGGVDLTLHCGYPSSYVSLLQQAGRAGRGQSARASSAIVVCFNSPSEQHLWRHPKSLLGKGAESNDTIPLRGATLQAHLLCAAAETPLCGDKSSNIIYQPEECDYQVTLPDCELFGDTKDDYFDAIGSLLSSKALRTEEVAVPVVDGGTIKVHTAAPSKVKPWSRVSIRAIEPVNYAIVDLSHPGQGGKSDAIYDKRAILDTLPYSRVFYHAHPGAIITHRGRKYKILSMTRPPAFDQTHAYRSTTNLAAFAKPTNAQYVTRPLGHLHINVIKQLEHVQLEDTLEKYPVDNLPDKTESTNISDDSGNDKTECDGTGDEKDKQEVFLMTFAGCGAVSVKRSVHGYKKLSLITRQELSRSELSLPEMEFDTSGLWIDTDITRLHPFLGEKYGHGVHALCHAIMAVAPLFVSGLAREDIQCDHNPWQPTHMMLFDEQAGGSGCVHRMWHCFFKDDNVLDAAIDLLEECTFCQSDSGYDGGCPACIHASECLKFNMHLSRSAGAIIGKHMRERIRKTRLYEELQQRSKVVETTPRRKAREKALNHAKEMLASRDRQYVVGRPSWPMDRLSLGKQELE